MLNTYNVTCTCTHWDSEAKQMPYGTRFLNYLIKWFSLQFNDFMSSAFYLYNSCYNVTKFKAILRMLYYNYCLEWSGTCCDTYGLPLYEWQFFSMRYMNGSFICTKWCNKQRLQKDCPWILLCWQTSQLEIMVQL